MRPLRTGQQEPIIRPDSHLKCGSYPVVWIRRREPWRLLRGLHIDCRSDARDRHRLRPVFRNVRSFPSLNATHRTEQKVKLAGVTLSQSDHSHLGLWKTKGRNRKLRKQHWPRRVDLVEFCGRHFTRTRGRPWIRGNWEFVLVPLRYIKSKVLGVSSLAGSAVNQTGPRTRAVQSAKCNGDEPEE